MSGEGTNDRHHAEPSAEQDAVAEFFAAARTHVRDEPATDIDWRRIVGEARRSARRRNRMAWLSSAAVAVIAIFAVFLWQQNGIDTGVQRGEAVVGGNNPVTTGEPTTSPSSVSSAQRPTKVPDSFRTWSVSNAGQSTLYALGSERCSGGACPVLLRSNTNGKSWNAVHTFADADVSSATGRDVHRIQPPRAVTQTRFATPQVGYVFGGDLWVTRDSGASFTKMGHPGSTVLDVEINRKQAVLLSADNCAQGECNGPIYVSRFDPATKAISEADATMTPSSPISAGRVTVQNGQAFVQLSSADRGTSIAPMRLDDTKLTPLAAPPACAGSTLESVTPATNNSTTLELFALCNPQQSGSSHTSYTIVRSDDAGKSWQSVSVTALTLPRLGDVWLAAADSKHLVASAGGPRETAGVPAPSGDGSLMRSTNGGLGFGPATPPKGHKTPSTGFDWTASAGGGIFYAVPRTTHGFWTTNDYGTTWTVVDPRR